MSTHTVSQRQIWAINRGCPSSAAWAIRVRAAVTWGDPSSGSKCRRILGSIAIIIVPAGGYALPVRGDGLSDSLVDGFRVLQLHRMRWRAEDFGNRQRVEVGWAQQQTAVGGDLDAKALAGFEAERLPRRLGQGHLPLTGESGLHDPSSLQFGMVRIL